VVRAGRAVACLPTSVGVEKDLAEMGKPLVDAAADARNRDQLSPSP
jgi:hypothetical protein